MTETERPIPPSPRRWPLRLALAFAVAAAGWTAAWTWARGRLIGEIDARLPVLAERGVRIVCPERSVGGWPFRLEVSCRDPGVEIAAEGVGGSVAALRVAVSVWAPTVVTLEADGPLVAEAAGRGRLGASWRRLSMGAHWRLAGAERATLSIDGLDAATETTDGHAGRLKAEHLEAQGRIDGDRASDLGLAVSAAAATLEIDGGRVGPPHADLSLTASLRDALPPGPGEPARAFAARGGRIEPIRAAFAVDGVRVAGKGALVLGADGLLDGTVDFAAEGLEAGMRDAARLGPQTTGLLGAFVLLGKPSRDPELTGRHLELVIDHGRPRFGRLVGPPMAPLFRPGSGGV